MNFIILEKGQNGDNGDISCHSRKELTNASNASLGHGRMLYVKFAKGQTRYVSKCTLNWT